MSTVIGAVLTGGLAYAVDKTHKVAEARRLIQTSPADLDRDIVAQGSTDFRLDTLDTDLRILGLRSLVLDFLHIRPRGELSMLSCMGRVRRREFRWIELGDGKPVHPRRLFELHGGAVHLQVEKLEAAGVEIDVPTHPNHRISAQQRGAP